VQAAGLVVQIVLSVFIACMWIRFIVSWVQVFARQWNPRGVLLLALEAVFSVTDPPINALRKVVPQLRIGSVSLDLSFLIVFVAAYLLLQVNASVLLRG